MIGKTEKKTYQKSFFFSIFRQTFSANNLLKLTVQEKHFQRLEKMLGGSTFNRNKPARLFAQKWTKPKTWSSFEKNLVYFE